MTAKTSTTGRRREPLGHVFWTLWAGRALSALGGYVQFLALPLWIQQTTGSALAGLAAFAVFSLPKLVVSPFAGVVADRFDRRCTVVVTDLLAAAVAAAMALAVPGRHIGPLLVLLTLLQVLAAVRVPALTSVLPDAFPPGRLLAANSLLDAATGAAMVLGPVAGTALLAASGIQTVLLVNAATFVVAAACMLPVRPAAPAADVPAHPLKAIAQGVRALVADPVLRCAVLSEGAVYLFFGAASELLALELARRHGAQASGMFGMGGGIGWIAVTLLLGRLRRSISPAALLLTGAAATLPVAVIASVLTVRPTGDAGVALAGFLISAHCFVYGLGPVLLCQQRPADSMRGRVLATRRTWNTFWQLTAFGVGAALTQHGNTTSVLVFGGFAATAAAVPAAVLARRHERGTAPRPTSATPAPVTTAGSAA
ncbi:MULTISPECIES: MFS transporter [unclassified Streptomyces]|uniref:MFS transporter n=1 Tax=unclassified Streptomyces TaxID=2593676 RepID=UPI00382425B7